jgi:16S rRNA (cytosine1402-N4)-methyltransferase
MIDQNNQVPPLSPSHKSVMVPEVLHAISPAPGKLYVDATFGAGGHTRALLEHEPTCRVIAIDWDLTSIEAFGYPLQEEFKGRLQVIWGNFAQLTQLLKKAGAPSIDGILADFGTSQMQIFDRAGFSLYRDTPLDMRMSPAHQRVTAAELLRTASYQTLCEILWDFGDERRAKLIVTAIIQERKKRPITTTSQLTRIVESVLGGKTYHRIHPATKTFQALRVYINKELENIRSFLIAALRSLAPDGRMVCISFHSLEDRLVKHFFKDHEHTGQLEIVEPALVMPSARECEENPSARSARLRAAQRVATSV